MAENETIGTKLSRMRIAAGMSLEEVAKAGGWKGRSSVQRFFTSDYDPDRLPWEAAQKFIEAFRNKLEGEQYTNDIFALAGVPVDTPGGIFPVQEKVGNIGDLPRDVPVFGTALGSEARFDMAEGTGSLEVEQAALDQTEVLGFLRRPPALVGRKDVYGVYVSGSSMFPRFNDGEAVFVDPRRPPMIGDDVIIQLASPDDHDGDRITTVLIKRLVRRTATQLELAQFNPALTFRLSAQQVKAIHRIVPTAELFS